MVVEQVQLEPREPWRATENNRLARYYVLTAAGKRAIALFREFYQRSGLPASGTKRLRPNRALPNSPMSR
jgi:hypothetical protein